MRIFLRDQQVKLKKDLGAYNTLSIKDKSEEGLTQAEYNKAEKLRVKIMQGQRQTMREIIYEETERKAIAGESIEILKKDVSPRTARRGLIALESAYGIESEILMYQTGAAIIAPVLGATKTGAAILTGVGKIIEPLKYTTIPFGLTYSGFAGVKEYGRHKDIGDAISAGIGAGAGFFGAMYSKEIFEGGKKVAVKVVEKVKDLPDPIKIATHPARMGKRGQASMYDQEQVYKKAVKKAKAKGITINEALREINIDNAVKLNDLKISLKHSKKKDVIKWLEKVLGELKKNKSLSAADKDRIAKNIYDFVKDVRPDLFAKPRPMPDVKQEYFSMFDKQVVTEVPEIKVATASVVQEVQETIPALSVFTGLGMYEKTDQVKVEQLTEPITALSYDQETDTDVKLGVQTISGITSLTAQTPVSITSPAITQPTITQFITPPTPSEPTGTEPSRPPKPEPREVKISEPPMPKIVGLYFGRKPKRKKDLVQAYYGEVMVKGKYRKVTTKPNTKAGAMDRIARVIDNTISGQGRIVPMKKKVQRKNIRKGDGYYGQNRNKFRGFKMFAGKKKLLKDTIIEKKQYRLDTAGETSGMTVAQFQSRSRKRAAGIPVRKSKKRSRFRL